MGGTLSGEHGVGLTKAPYIHLELDQVEIEVMKKIKKVLDPNNILNPGKIFKHDGIRSLKEIAEKCVRCGLCQSVCPVFAELQKETAVARGKVSLIRKVLSEDAGYSERLSTHLLQCLGCGACTESCPNGVQADELILAARALMVESKGLSFPKWLILRKILNSVSLLPMLLKTGSLLQGLRFQERFLARAAFTCDSRSPIWIEIG